MFFITLYTIKITAQKSNKMVIFTKRRPFCSGHNEPPSTMAKQEGPMVL
jgi:hypothetical protein